EFDASAAADFDLKAGAESELSDELADVLTGDTLTIDDEEVQGSADFESGDDDLDDFDQQAEAMWARLAIELGGALETTSSDGAELGRNASGVSSDFVEDDESDEDIDKDDEDDDD
ncbi:MAG: hypothetical protein KGQ38_07450, partial [Actinomycetales bacterium]|nr:hypothetical protein [Actinomycetales bacterium]